MEFNDGFKHLNNHQRARKYLEVWSSPQAEFAELKDKLIAIQLHMLESMFDNESLICDLPVECTFWEVFTTKESDRTIRVMQDQRGNVLATCTDEFLMMLSSEQTEPYTKLLEDTISMLFLITSNSQDSHSVVANLVGILPVYLSFFGLACLNPLAGPPRRPLGFVDDNTVLSIHHPIPMLQIPLFTLYNVPDCECRLKASVNAIFRCCHYCGFSADSSLLSLGFCGSCKLVFYCSEQCSLSDNTHKDYCEKSKQFYSLYPQLQDHPFPFAKVKHVNYNLMWL